MTRGNKVKELRAAHLLSADDSILAEILRPMGSPGFVALAISGREIFAKIRGFDNFAHVSKR